VIGEVILYMDMAYIWILRVVILLFHDILLSLISQHSASLVK